jgi:uncharacterized pyridoxamine 5'-phosphate oxidase family protein
MEEIYEFLKKNGTYFLATVEDNQPKVRPFGTAIIFEDKLYIQSSKTKQVAKQIATNPSIAISASTSDTWLRIEAIAVEDNRVEPKKQMLDEYPSLRSLYNENDPNNVVWFLKDATATIEKFGGKKKTFHF